MNGYNYKCPACLGFVAWECESPFKGSLMWASHLEDTEDTCVLYAALSPSIVGDNDFIIPHRCHRWIAFLDDLNAQSDL